jgi:MoCo/4Fe-4S cofactor protein with predicted Tat translocation signal
MSRGKTYWRSLEERANTPEFQQWLQREFPAGASMWEDEVSRRQFLKIMGASFALAGLTGCIKMPQEKIVPYVQQPEEIIPGKPLFFATAMTLGGYATGLLVESHEGRPTKIEGNPSHPASLGATDVWSQASILTLYDPDRSQTVLRSGQISTWTDFLDALGGELTLQKSKRGAGLRILTETISSPTVGQQITALLETFPEANWHQYEPLARDNVLDGARLALGEVVETRYRFDKAAVVLALDSDFLFTGPGWVRYARDFIDQRRMRRGTNAMNRLYVIEPSPTTTGGMADHRWSIRTSDIEQIARNLPAAVASDLQAHRGGSIVIVGEHQPPVVHALAHQLNHQLGNVGSTVIYTDPVAAHPVNQLESLRELVNEMNTGKVEALIIFGGNPVYNAPADFDFAGALQKVRFRAQLGLYDDETSQLCHWHVPAAHYLESWSDTRAFDGTVTIQQPLIAPLYGGKSAHELITAMAGEPERTGYNLVRERWKTLDNNAWEAALHDGVVPQTQLPEKPVRLRGSVERGNVQREGWEILFRPDPTIRDGEFCNNGWLQELPKPLTRLTWDNVAIFSPASAEKLGVKNEDLVELKLDGRTVRAPTWILPGQADETVVVTLGYGRKHAGHIGNGAGFDAYRIRSSQAQWLARGAEIRKLGKRRALASVQHHHSMQGRDFVKVASMAEFIENPEFARNELKPPSLYPAYPFEGYKWGMVIDLSACVGCTACVVACQSENNIPVVGKGEVHHGREMHWIRIDRYFGGEPERPEIYFEPVPCMHCENAPCELVCPVAATNHSDDGLNAMIYNRCVGTRYCSNNCPYKVRRFNFLQYSDTRTESVKMVYNPNVTVRNRGVMEKCTYCVQRIQAGKITAENQDRRVRDGEVVPACAQACPTQAIIFGDMNDPNSEVAKLKTQPHHYGLLVELNTQPRTTYLARIRNPNPVIKS